MTLQSGLSDLFLSIVILCYRLPIRIMTIRLWVFVVVLQAFYSFPAALLCSLKMPHCYFYPFIFSPGRIPICQYLSRTLWTLARENGILDDQLVLIIFERKHTSKYLILLGYIIDNNSFIRSATKIVSINYWMKALWWQLG